MARPCINRHATLQPAACRYCYWCVSRSAKGEGFRKEWEEPEPGVDVPEVGAWENISENSGNAPRSQVKVAEGIPCVYRGEPTGERQLCDTCKGKVNLNLFTCQLYGKCTLERKVETLPCCAMCESYKPDLSFLSSDDGSKPKASGVTISEFTVLPSKATSNEPTPVPILSPPKIVTEALPARVKPGWEVRWAYGVTTVPERAKTLLPKTLVSLAAAGFDSPRLFVDRCSQPHKLYAEWIKLGLEVSAHAPALRTAGNWVLSLHELYLRSPTADRYALFQDDLVTYPNLRVYLEACPYPEKGYLNLHTFPSNYALVPKDAAGREKEGWYLSNQFGRSALALVFSRDAVVTLLSSRYLVERAQDAHRGWKSIDGGIISAMKEAGYAEWVHHPSLTQHTGTVSSMGNRPHPPSPSFRGEDYDAVSLLPPSPESELATVAATSGPTPESISAPTPNASSPDAITDAPIDPDPPPS